jgi:hypothetical protein
LINDIMAEQSNRARGDVDHRRDQRGIENERDDAAVRRMTLSVMPTPDRKNLNGRPVSPTKDNMA